MSQRSSSYRELDHFPSGTKSEHAFKRTLSNRSHPMCVIVVSSTCSYCTQMRPELRKLESRLRRSNLPPAAVVDIETARSSTHPALQSIDRVPSIISLPVGLRSRPTMHTGPRTADSLLEFIKSTSGSSQSGSRKESKSKGSKTKRRSKSKNSGRRSSTRRRTPRAKKSK